MIETTPYAAGEPEEPLCDGIAPERKSQRIGPLIRL